MTNNRSGPDRDPAPNDEGAFESIRKLATNKWLQAMVISVGAILLCNWLKSNLWSGWTSYPGPRYSDVSEQEQSERIYLSDDGLTEPWNKIRPRRELEYHNCFNGFDCARLDVPMDWNSTDADGPRVNLAIAKLPAIVPVTDPRYGGLLWLQIGGPGSSGVNFILNHGKTVQMIVDSKLDPSDTQYDQSNPPKYYDVLGMDPRGVNNTTPRISCFPTVASRNIWMLQSDAEGVIGSSDSSFATMWARAKALGEGCSARVKNSDTRESEIAFHMNTAPFVRDIVEIIEQHGNWREGQALWSLIRPADEWTGELRHESRVITNRTKWREGEERLLYWGLSYGTVVGATFAAMQPHRVERAVIDAVVDTSDYYRGEWLTNLQDTDTILDNFCEYCDKAGPKTCALYTTGGKDKVKQRFKDIFESLKGNPIGVAAHGALAPDLITYSDLKSRIATALYAPLQYWSNLAELLVDLENRNGTSFALLKQQEQQFPAPAPECHSAPPYTPSCAIPPNSFLEETQTAILCTDGNSTYGISLDTFAEYVAELGNQSWLMGDWWASVRLGCVGWNVKPKWRFPGPFTGETAHPMMFVGNMRDPVTPIRNAHEMASGFPGSAVLATEAEGHCVLTAPSLCMAKHIREYFQTGRLPEKGTVCEANEKAFVGTTDIGDPGDKELLEQLRWSARHFFA